LFFQTTAVFDRLKFSIDVIEDMEGLQRGFYMGNALTVKKDLEDSHSSEAHEPDPSSAFPSLPDGEFSLYSPCRRRFFCCRLFPVLYHLFNFFGLV
jgi:hypothetical protein